MLTYEAHTKVFCDTSHFPRACSMHTMWLACGKLPLHKLLLAPPSLPKPARCIMAQPPGPAWQPKAPLSAMPMLAQLRVHCLMEKHRAISCRHTVDAGTVL